MKKYQIEFQGQVVQTIEADTVRYDKRHGNSLFYVRASQRLVAIVPLGYMIIQIPQQPIKETK